MKRIYLIGSLRNPEVPAFATVLRHYGFEVFDDWYAAGPEADDYWKAYEQTRGHSFEQALRGWASHNVVSFDRKNLDRADIVILLMPAGKSGHLELGRSIGRDSRCMIVIEDDKDRWDQMYGLVYHTTVPGEVVRGQQQALEVLLSWRVE